MKTALLFTIIHVAGIWIKTRAHLCMLNQVDDPDTGQVFWSVPSHERCLCQGVVAPQSDPPCDEKVLKEERWLTTDHKSLTRRENWTPEALDTLLERSVLCYTDECLSSPCQHDGSCYDRIGAYYCSCDDAYVGETCEIAIWTSWGSWTTCSTTSCGNGTQTRNRLCGFGLETDLCDGEVAEQNETKSCQHESICPFWGTWGNWTFCSDPCDIENPSGNHTRYRECVNPDMVDGTDFLHLCEGNDTDDTPCTKETCELELAAKEKGCFASTSLIRFNTSSGIIARKTLDKLKAGEHVESYDPIHDSTIFSEVYFITHEGDIANSTKLLKLLYLNSENEEGSICLHPKHLVYACSKKSKIKATMDAATKIYKWCDQPPDLPVTADSVKVGDLLWVRNSMGKLSSKPVIGIGEMWSSVRHPMTFSHYIVINDVLASVHMYDEGLYRQATVPLRFLYNISPAITQTSAVLKLVELWDILEKYWL